MKVGDRVKILEGSHAFKGDVGTVTISHSDEDKVEFPWDFSVLIDGFPQVGDCPFYESELEVVL